MIQKLNQHYSILFWITLFLLSCKNKKQKIVALNFKNSIIIDTSEGENKYREYNKKEREGFYCIFYIGLKKDTIQLSTKPLSAYSNSEIKYNKATFASSKNIEIIVDTNANVNFKNECFHYDKEKDKRIFDSVINYKSWYVFISNKCDSLVEIGKFNFFKNTIRQVCYENQWKDLEYIETGYCGTGVKEIFLDKNEIAIAKLIRYKGAKKYLCRLKMTSFNGEIYSNTFFDYVDEKQLTDLIIKEY